MNTAPTVAVLMSTHNGAPWLQAQLDSILAQHVAARVCIHVRDDASSDDSLALLESFRAAHSAVVHIHAGARLGVIDSFLWLIEHVGDADFYALADQDDVWLDGKLAAALAALGEAGGEAALYASAFEYVDRALAPLGVYRSRARLDLGNLLVENTLPGCTMVFNRALRELVLARTAVLAGQRAGIVMHDWWIAQLAVLHGRIHYDPEPRILYRQHGRNLVGIASGPLARLRARWRTLRALRTRASFVDQARALRAASGSELDPAARRAIERVCALGGPLPQRLRALCSPAFRRSRPADDFALRLFALAGVFRRP